MANIAFNDEESICISSHLMNSICRAARLYVHDNRLNVYLKLAAIEGTINLKSLSAAECTVFLRGIEDTIRAHRDRGGRDANMIAGVEDIVINIRAVIRGKTE